MHPRYAPTYQPHVGDTASLDKFNDYFNSKNLVNNTEVRRPGQEHWRGGLTTHRKYIPRPGGRDGRVGVQEHAVDMHARRG